MFSYLLLPWTFFPLHPTLSDFYFGRFTLAPLSLPLSTYSPSHTSLPFSKCLGFWSPQFIVCAAAPVVLSPRSYSHFPPSSSRCVEYLSRIISVLCLEKSMPGLIKGRHLRPIFSLFFKSCVLLLLPDRSMMN